MSDFKMYSIFSGNLNRVGWKMDEKKEVGVLRVEFQKGDQYDYFPVEKEKFLQIFSQEISRGKWFDSEIKKDPTINYSKVPDEEKTP